MDQNFIRRATHVRFLNFEKKDFLSTKYKSEIQHLIKMHHFANFDLKNTLNSLEKNSYNRAVKTLKQLDAGQFKILHNSKLEGLGPGELAMYFLLNNAYLGGTASSGVDVFDGKEKYELKAVDVNSKKQAFNFMVGSKAGLAPVSVALTDLCRKYGVPGTTSTIAKTSIDKLRQAALDEFNIIEDVYKNIVADYFKDAHAVFISNRSRDLGEILDIKKVKPQDVTIERVTNNNVKPYIQL